MIKINSFISSQVYNFEEENSKSYIIDEKNRSDIMLDGVSSDIWQIILKTQDYSSVVDYAKKLGVEEQVDDFLNELVESNVIEIQSVGLKDSLSSPHSCENSTSIETISEVGQTNSRTCGGFEDEDEYTEERTKWLYENNFLQYLALQLNYKCNLACKHCFNDKEHNDIELSFEQVKDIVDQAYDLGITTVGITGGECTTNRDFLKIIRYIREKRLSLIFLSNGQKLYDDKELFESVVSLYPHRVKLSLYSMDEKIHDAITGVKGSCKKTIEVIKRLRERNILVTINFLQLDTNYGSYDDVVAFGTSIGARTDVAVHFINNPKNKNGHLRVQGEKLIKLYMDKNFPHSVHNLKLQGFKKDNRTVCRASEIVLSVSPFMQVTPCNDFDYSLGDLRKESLKDIWNISVPKFRQQFLRKNMVECGNNEYCSYCSYCPMRAYYENGFMKKSNCGCEHAVAFLEAKNKLETFHK